MLFRSETIMLDLIKEVGPGGTFVNQAKSASQCRREAWTPSVLDRNPYNAWRDKGSLSTEDLINKKLKKILDNHQPLPLPEGVQSKLNKILIEAEERESTH